jgi:hypothetical protein
MKREESKAARHRKQTTSPFDRQDWNPYRYIVTRSFGYGPY